MANPSSTSIYQGVRCFLSIDLVGSSALKLGTARGSAPPKPWVDLIANFYEDILRYLIYETDNITDELDPHLASLHIWKASGDEILLYTERLSSALQVKTTFVRLFHAVTRIDRAYKEDYGLGAKGTMWMAGFPNRNREFFVSSSAPFFRFFQGPFDTDRGSLRDDEFMGNDQRLDFLGPEIDLGFRLSAHTHPGRVVTSFDVAKFLADSGYHKGTPIAFHHVGWAPLKGIYGEIPYPIFWVEVRDDRSHPQPRTTYEESLSPFSKEFLSKSSDRKMTDIQGLYKNYVSETNGKMIEMYIDEIDMPEAHKRSWAAFGDKQKNVK